MDKWACGTSYLHTLAGQRPTVPFGDKSEVSDLAACSQCHIQRCTLIPPRDRLCKSRDHNEDWRGDSSASLKGKLLCNSCCPQLKKVLFLFLRLSLWLPCCLFCYVCVLSVFLSAVCLAACMSFSVFFSAVVFTLFIVTHVWNISILSWPKSTCNSYIFMKG